MKAHARLSRGASSQPAVVDRRAAATDLMVVLSIIGLGLIPSPHGESRSVLAAVLLPLPLLWRRRWPLPVLGLLIAVALVRLASGENSISDIVVVVALYTVAATHSARVTLAAAVVCELGAIAAVARYSQNHWLQVLIAMTGLVIAATAVGTSVRGRRALVASLRERAARLEVERDQQGRLAAAAERARIAREMHDVVAHNLSVMVALADGAGFAARGAPDQAERAMRDVARTGRDALSEMRRLLGVLRDEQEPGRAPQPRLEQLDELIEQVRAAGMGVDLRIAGAPATVPSPGLQLAAFRIVQESLTNALKHAGRGAHATVDLTWAGDRLTIDIHNTGRVSDVRSPGGGLVGMRERASAFGGALRAGPDPAGGWRVHTELGDTSEPSDALAGARP